MISRIRESIDGLAAFPFSGRRGIVPETRERPVGTYPYTIIYLVTDEAIIVLNVLHQRRKYP